MGAARPDPSRISVLAAGILVLVQDPPVVRLPHHPAGAGYILQWRQKRDRSWEALIEYVMDAPGWRGGLQPPEQTWMPAHEVEPVNGEDYRRVPHTKLNTKSENPA